MITQEPTAVPSSQGGLGNGHEDVFLRRQFEASQERNAFLEKENQELRKEVGRLRSQVASLRAHDNERKSWLWKKIQCSMDNENALLLTASQQKPPPGKEPDQHRVPKVIAVPPSPAPPPPPPPSKSLARTKAVRRVPEVVELYRVLTKKDVFTGDRPNPAGAPAAEFNRNMIGEIENRSTYLSAIKTEVVRQGQFINFLIKEVDSAAFGDISDVETFVKWLDEELSSLVDERAVLKHFPQWPEQKADAMREAAFSYRDLRGLDLEVATFQDSSKEPLASALRRMHTLQDRLEGSIGNIERTRESMMKRYRDFQIPWKWMLDTGLIGQMKLSSLRLAKECMKRTARELHSNGNGCLGEGSILLQAVRFAYRIHQFAGGFDEETIQAFEELKKFRSG
ncbi:hypothetical protein SAY87_016337 [Trapa incisa]|uniref:Protein CHUP1, chloroplastic n=1 Tax=Trapa incisa TaxID=236973 RepID=A0AAN7LGS9_9MYRT|nr:hypothetical protein SAY87_016337 [Trapa incisa]